MRKWIMSVAMLLSTIILYGCYRHETTVPVAAKYYDGAERHSDILIVMLPGRGGSMKDFEKESFTVLARKEGVTSDIVTVDLHEGYYYNRTMVERLRMDVVEPALKKGYQKIWFVGVSLGGFGALMYTKENHSNIAGILLVAPYLGDNEIVEEIEKAGGIQKWETQSKSSAEQYEVDLWNWLKDGHNEVPLYLLYGTEDRMAASHKFLAELLPPDHTITVPGGHNWGTWKSLWKLLLNKKLLQ